MKDIPRYEGLYAASEDGKIWSYSSKRGQDGRKGKFLKPWLIGNGYEVVMLYFPNAKFLVHRLIALTYIPNPKNLREVNHKNANRLDNRVENLEWVSSKQNKKHAINLGLYDNLGKNTPKGSKYPTAKLTEKQAKFIKKSKGKIKQRDLAQKFGISYGLVGHIWNGRAWKHID